MHDPFSSALLPPSTVTQRSAIDARVIDPPELAALLLESYHDRRALQLVSAVQRWLNRARSIERAEKPLCINCRHVFHDAKPAAFAVAFIEVEEIAVVTGICGCCMRRAEREPGGVLAMAVKCWRSLWPDLVVAAPSSERSH
jgi:hypothetical protein